MGRCILIVALALLMGCSVRKAGPKDAAMDQASPQTTAGSGPKTVPLNLEKAFIAEVRCARGELGGKIRALSAFDAHQTWTEQFVSDTVAEAKWLKKGERIEGPMVAHMGQDSAEATISITRVDAATFAVRAVCSHEEIHAGFRVALGSK